MVNENLLFRSRFMCVCGKLRRVIFIAQIREYFQAEREYENVVQFLSLHGGKPSVPEK
jgi:hypothetical protein